MHPPFVVWHLEDDLVNDRSLWAVTPSCEKVISALKDAEGDPDERSHAYDSLPLEVSVQLLSFQKGEVREAEVFPRPLELESLLDAALEAFD